MFNRPFFVLCASVVLADIGLIVCAAARDIGTFIGGYVIFNVGSMSTIPLLVPREYSVLTTVDSCEVSYLTPSCRYSSIVRARWLS